MDDTERKIVELWTNFEQLRDAFFALNRVPQEQKRKWTMFRWRAYHELREDLRRVTNELLAIQNACGHSSHPREKNSEARCPRCKLCPVELRALRGLGMCG